MGELLTTNQLTLCFSNLRRTIKSNCNVTKVSLIFHHLVNPTNHHQPQRAATGSIMVPENRHHQRDFNHTSKNEEGPDLSCAGKVWTLVAHSECRMELLSRLVSKNLGLKEVQDIAESLEIQFRSENLKNNSEKAEKKIVSDIMRLKLRDEKAFHGETVMKRNMIRRQIYAQYGKNSRRSRTILKNLRNEATKEKTIMNKIYEKKLEFLRDKYETDDETKLDEVPDDLKEYSDAMIFTKEKFEKIELDVMEVAVVGEVELSDAERQVLSLHPKFGIMERLEVTDYELDLILGFAKLLYQLSKEVKLSYITSFNEPHLKLKLGSFS